MTVNRLIAQHLSHHQDRVTLASFVVNADLGLADVQQTSMSRIVHDWQLPLASADVGRLFNHPQEPSLSLLEQLLEVCKEQLQRAKHDAAVDTVGLGSAADAVRAGSTRGYSPYPSVGCLGRCGCSDVL
jgi:hypothetical protein